ncbi:MAG: NAD(P)/FAD-dependent oxidoreductase [Candidatus Heimdallarchaeota archaeon]|nr:NAD(P)/FAD-dependent oxidoreductase [Candidatus Heimdallarchaeota archaeon]MCK4771048.1 NAD(P)/FAD-dependent oxidoreductase [Candidatus Heimdallarchaeota archaeon]
MVEYDLIVAGGGIAGSIAAKFAARGGLRTLLIERRKTPRNKPCSGIQFGYFEKILGEKIPQDRLCNVELNKIKMILPDGKSIGAPFKMFNFMRKSFDHWLNLVAQESGATFIDDCICQSIEEQKEQIVVNLVKPNEKKEFQFKTKYFIDATGLRPKIRSQLRPEDFSSGFEGATLNYYIEGEADLDPETLYQFWNLDWNNAMFAWIYVKTLDDGKDYWVVGTGCNDTNVNERQEKFYNHVKKEFNITGEIIKREGYKTSMNLLSKNRVWLGRNRIIMAGDAAGLVDPTRGVGMDSAALSGRIAAKAILKAERKNKDVLKIYSKMMKDITTLTIRNQEREIGHTNNNEELQEYIEKSMLKQGFAMLLQTQFNKIRRAEKQRLLPP